jgi:hypothetical protein
MSLLKTSVFGAQPYGFKATDLSGCNLWLDATDVTTLYSSRPIIGIDAQYTNYSSANSQQVSVWQDKSTGANDMIRPFDNTNFNNNGTPYNNSPLIVAPDTYPTPWSVLNLNQGVIIEGSLSANSPSYLEQNISNISVIRTIPPTLSQARGPRQGTGLSATADIFVIAQPKYLTNSPGDLFSIGSRPGKTADYTSLSITSSGYWKINSPGGIRDVTSSVPEVFNTFSNYNGPDPNYRIIHMSLSNTNYVLRRNSYTVGTGNYSWTPSVGNLRYYVGKKNSDTDAGNYFNGKIGEIIVYNQIITTEKRLIVESYLANKWNLVDLLPLDHPARLKNIPIALKGLSIAAAPNGYTRRGNMVKIFVEGPEPPTVNTPVISAGGITFTVTWSPNGGPVDYYNITINNSTDDATWNYVASAPLYRGTSYVYIIGGIDNHYYQAVVQAKNAGGFASTTSTSAFDAVPSSPSPNIPIVVSTNDLQMSWTPVYPGGFPSSYSIYLYTSTDGGSTFTQTDTYTTSSTTYTVAAKCVLFSHYKIKVTASNSIGTSAQSVFSTEFIYNGAGG